MGHGTGWSLQARPSRSTRASHRRTASPVAELGRGRPRIVRWRVSEPGKQLCTLARDRDIEQLSQPGVGYRGDELLHVAVPLLRILGVDAEEPAGLVLFDLLDGERQLGVLGEQKHFARLGIEYPRILTAPIV